MSTYHANLAKLSNLLPLDVDSDGKLSADDVKNLVKYLSLLDADVRRIVNSVNYLTNNVVS